MGKRADAKAAMKERLLGIAREAFRRRGYEAVTFRSLAADAGVSTGSFFGSFTSKAELFEAAMECPAPDVVMFLERVAIECAGDQISLDALELRGHLIGREGLG